MFGYGLALGLGNSRQGNEATHRSAVHCSYEVSRSKRLVVLKLSGADGGPRGPCNAAVIVGLANQTRGAGFGTVVRRVKVRPMQTGAPRWRVAVGYMSRGSGTRPGLCKILRDVGAGRWCGLSRGGGAGPRLCKFSRGVGAMRWIEMARILALRIDVAPQRFLAWWIRRGAALLSLAGTTLRSYTSRLPVAGRRPARNKKICYESALIAQIGESPPSRLQDRASSWQGFRDQQDQSALQGSPALIAFAGRWPPARPAVHLRTVFDRRGPISGLCGSGLNTGGKISSNLRRSPVGVRV